MKVFGILLATVVMSLNAFAGTEVEQTALETLLATNPTAVSAYGDGEDAKVSFLLGMMMTSSFDKNGDGTLSVITNECTAVEGSTNLECHLFILNSDRKHNKETDAYEPAEAMTESSMSIIYTVDSTGKTIIGKVTHALAG